MIYSPGFGQIGTFGRMSNVFTVVARSETGIKPVFCGFRFDRRAPWAKQPTI